MDDAFRECAARLRAADFERHVCVILAPAAARRNLTALYCFHHEIGRIGDLVSEPLPGEIRLQWWRDAVAGQGHGDVAGHPVAALLLQAVGQGALAPAGLERMIDARADALYAEPPETMDEMKRRVLATGGALFAAAARILAGNEGADIEKLSQSAGLAEGLAGLVRNLGYDASHGRIALPLDLLAAHGVHTRDILAGREPEGLAGAVGAVLDSAEEALAAFRGQVGTLPRDVLPAFLTLALARPRIAQLRKAGRALLAPPPDLTPLGKFVRLLRARRGRFG